MPTNPSRLLYKLPRTHSNHRRTPVSQLGRNTPRNMKVSVWWKACTTSISINPSGLFNLPVIRIRPLMTRYNFFIFLCLYPLRTIKFYYRSSVSLKSRPTVYTIRTENFIYEPWRWPDYSDVCMSHVTHILCCKELSNLRTLPLHDTLKWKCDHLPTSDMRTRQ